MSPSLLPSQPSSLEVCSNQGGDSQGGNSLCLCASLLSSFPRAEFVVELGATVSRWLSGGRQRGAGEHGQWGRVTRLRETYFFYCCWWFLPLGSYSILPWFAGLPLSLLHNEAHIISCKKGGKLDLYPPGLIAGCNIFFIRKGSFLDPPYKSSVISTVSLALCVCSVLCPLCVWYSLPFLSCLRITWLLLIHALL